jgi:uncharacterized protein (TIGR02597 family)
MKTAIHLRFPILAALVGTLLAPLAAPAQNLMIGFNRVKCPPQSDTLVSVPFMKHPVAAVLRVSGAPDLSTQDQAVLTLGQNATWSNDSLKDMHYVRFTSGSKAGHWYDILGNTANALTVDLNGGDGTGIAAGDGFIVVEYWTLDSLFPPSSQTTIHVSPGTLGYQQKSLILIPNVNAEGINLPAEAFYLLTASGWKKGVKGFPAAGDTILPPGLPFIIRHSRGVAETTFEPEGRVLRSADAVDLAGGASTRQDNTVAVLRPVAVALADAGLDETAFVSSLSHSAEDRRDELLVFDNSIAGFNKKPSAIYYKVSGSWFREDGKAASNPPAGQEKALSASGGVVVRKALGTPAMATWKNNPTY